jgi:hypothetical protein
LSLRTRSNSQPAVACGYGEAQQGPSNIQGKLGRLEIPCWLLDIHSDPRKTRWSLRNHEARMIADH